MTKNRITPPGGRGPDAREAIARERDRFRQARDLINRAWASAAINQIEVL